MEVRNANAIMHSLNRRTTAARGGRGGRGQESRRVEGGEGCREEKRMLRETRRKCLGSEITHDKAERSGETEEEDEGRSGAWGVPGSSPPKIKISCANRLHPSAMHLQIITCDFIKMTITQSIDTVVSRSYRVYTTKARGFGTRAPV